MNRDEIAGFRRSQGNKTARHSHQYEAKKREERAQKEVSELRPATAPQGDVPTSWLHMKGICKCMETLDKCFFDSGEQKNKIRTHFMKSSNILSLAEVSLPF